MSSGADLFEFTSCEFKPEKKQAIFHYKTVLNNKDSISFTETIIFPKKFSLNHLPKGLIAKLLEGLHIILGISYYKFYCARKIKLPHKLSEEEAYFWRIIYQNGLREFLYRNQLNINIIPKFPYDHGLKNFSYNLEKNEKCLVAMGGGKDSIVSAELLKEGKFDVTAFFIQTQKGSSLVDKIIEVTDLKSLKIKRILDEKVFQKHQYNGHIPISSIYAFLGIFTAILYKYSYLIVSNEHSSNFGNLEYRGLMVNHQWSKSFEFEQLFQNYLKNFISSDIQYFSLLRPFHEIRIVKLFAKYKKYFPYFSSCNKNFSLTEKMNGGLWCGQCAKCVFVFTILSAFLRKKNLMDIFGRNLYKEENLLPLFKDILGFGAMKPFDCVGTFQEAQSAIYMARNKFKNDFIIQQVGDKVKYDDNVLKTSKLSNIPEKFRFLGMESILIVGYGKEGKATEQYFKKYYPKIKIGIADQEQGSDYLKKQELFDIAIKTPGIKKELITIPYTTATNIFFSKIKGKNMIIGITGSKGKSTTASLILEILKRGGKSVEIMGNIGIPMLGALFEPVRKNRIFVLELSSAQLADLNISPDISVVTNLFPEHMDYHGIVENYYAAKKNIINFQGKKDYFIYNPDNKIMKQWLKDYKGKLIEFSKNKYESSLEGEHNKKNIGAAVAVAKILNISDRCIKEAVKNFKSLSHRLEFVGEFKGIKFYDDAISTTPESTIFAIEALKNIDTIFLGGQDRGYDFFQLEKTIRRYKIRNIILFPESGDKIIKDKNGLNILEASSMEKAVEFAYEKTYKGKICLLSCASPSYSIWKNFEEKGSQFKYFVKKIGDNNK